MSKMEKLKNLKITDVPIIEKETQIEYSTIKDSDESNNTKESNPHKRRFAKLRKNYYISVGFLLLYINYFLSLEKCFDGEDGCSYKLKWIVLKIKEGIYSCALMVLMTQLLLFNIIPKLHLIHLILYFTLCFTYSHGFVFHDHGYFNFLYYFLLSGITTILLIPLDFILCLKKRKNNLKIIINYVISIITIFYLFYFLFTSKYANCDEWTKGLNNTFIENDRAKYGCQINSPSLCAYKLLESTQDFSKLKGKNCTKINNGIEEKALVLKESTSPYINDKCNRIGYPLLNKDPMCYLDSNDNDNILYKYFYKNIVDMDNEKILNEYYKENKPEVGVDFTDINEPKLIINVHYNKTLSEERKLLEKNSNPLANNVLILYVDSVSRVNGLRQLKKTTKFFEKFMLYKGYSSEKYPNENYHSFQFFKYYSFNGHTTINFPFLFYGTNSSVVNKSLITKYYKKNGFITSAANDWCNIDNIRTLHNFTVEDIYDHMLLLCDPNADHYSLNTIRCLYGKHNMEHLIEYTNQFWRKYSNNRKYSIIIDNHGHEGTLTVLRYIDDLLANFLNDLFNDNLLKDTIVFLMSDHGTGMPSLYYTMDFYRLEWNLPMLFILISDRKDMTYEEQYKYLHENQQTFITAFDLYNTYGHIINGDKYKSIKNLSENYHSCKSPYGLSLFNKINQKERYPSKYRYFGKLGITDRSCS